MSLQKKITKIELAKAINDFYVYCGYEITKSQIIELSKLIFQSGDSITSEYFYDFICQAKLGKLGMIYKSPISLMVAFNSYKERYPILRDCDEKGRPILRDTEGYGKRIVEPDPVYRYD